MGWIMLELGRGISSTCISFSRNMKRIRMGEGKKRAGKDSCSQRSRRLKARRRAS